jgi:phosphate transport system permease protein
MTPTELAPALPAPTHAGGGAGVPAARSASRMRARRRQLVDRIGGLAVRAGGLGIIGSILAILVFIVAQVLPLLSAPTVETVAVLPLPGNDVRALVADEHGSQVAALDLSGRVRVVRVRDQAVLADESILPADAPATALVAAGVPPASTLFTASTAAGEVVLAKVTWLTTYAGADRVSTPELAAPVVVSVDPARRPLGAYAVGAAEGRAQTVAAQLADGTLVLVRQQTQENEFTGEVTRREERLTGAVSARLTHLVFDHVQRNLFGADEHGQLFWWTIPAASGGQPQAPGALPAPQVVAAGSPVTALTMLIGGRALVVGQADGVSSVWFIVPQAEGGARLTRIRDYPALPGPVTALAPSTRDKGFLAAAGDRLGLYYSTSHRVLWTGPAPVPAGAIALAPKGTGAYVAGDGRLAVLAVDSPHPEVSLGSLFGRVWYEGYAQPEYVWQSSSGSDDFEPKLSLTPLLVGTLKGTVYSLLIAIPLAVLGAMYLSQFMHPGLKTTIKPAVEIMAALPSVVLGFLAGLWLAPRVQQMFPALMLMVLFFPLLTIAAGAAWEAVPRRIRGRFPAGSEVALFLPVLAFGLWLSMALSAPVERWLFGGNFPAWLLETTGLPYDQRNAIIVGLAMGFAVIPIIFAIAEDAFSNVPRELVSGSLALGANRWQTVTRIVLPTASPGIFSAIMVGFGRAVGETMIVLMATGNTPILDWNPFNGFRTLSANIAVEIPEAPQFGTLYRVLFLAALLLFALTFVVNTAAEMVRQRLRKRYARL